ncbi:Lipoprotein [Corallococcus soli]
MTMRDEQTPNLPTDMDPAPDSLELAIASFHGSPPGT